MQGVRDAASRNSFRTAGYLQYNFFEKEKGYVFAGTNLGKKKVLNVNGGFDMQKDYKAYSGDVFASIPVAKGDEIGGQVQWIHYDGGDFIKTIPKQDDLLVEAAYYLSKVKVQPFLKYESQKFAYDVDKAKDQDRFGGGLNYYVSGQNFKITAQYLRVDPKSSALKSTNQFTIQIQALLLLIRSRAAPEGRILPAPRSSPSPRRRTSHDDRHGSPRSPAGRSRASRREGSGPPSSGSRPPTGSSTGPMDRIAFASDASFYRLIPKAVVLAQSVDEVAALFRLARETKIPMTFRAAGTSLSGQAVTDGILVEVARHWRTVKVRGRRRRGSGRSRASSAPHVNTPSGPTAPRWGRTRPPSTPARWAASSRTTRAACAAA